MKKYTKITFCDGRHCVIDNPGDLDAMVKGWADHEWTTSDVEMTEEEFNALPEFEG